MSAKKYIPYTLSNFRTLPQIQKLPEEQRLSIELVGQVFHFKTNNYVVEELIDWDNIPNDPLYLLNFFQRDMLTPQHFDLLLDVFKKGADPQKVQEMAKYIRSALNPHPAGQITINQPLLKRQLLGGIQHKYAETILFFPSQGQTCHAYCSFCFRWPQFVGNTRLKFVAQDIELLCQYLDQHHEVTDVLFTGGDPLVMKAQILARHINPLLKPERHHLTTIRIGTKSFGFWPYRFLSDTDAEELLTLFKKVTQSGKHLAIMAHFNHPRELETLAAQEAIGRVQATGAQIRTQSPLLAHINDIPELWGTMLKEQVRLGCFPYYMFIVRDTGAQQYFGVTLERAWRIFRAAYQNVSGLGRTLRGPVMSTYHGKILLLGIENIQGEKVFVMQMLQGRNPDWVLRLFFAKYDAHAIWFDELKPAFGQANFFFQETP
jgi:L-lysine 2,3-aminomutase